jgi:FkbM family methyltransferase
MGLTRSRRRKRLIKAWRWRIASAVGIHRYTWASLDGLDRRIVELFGPEFRGTFVELGANDGLQQSNTLARETLHGWRGLLIEADPVLAGECCRNRPRATVVCAAAARGWGVVGLDSADQMGSIAGVPDAATREAHDLAVVAAAPLADLVLGAGLEHVDLLSLDVEGYELHVLAGLEIDRLVVDHFLVETQEPEAVLELLGPRYEHAAAWTQRDHLFSVRRPGSS